MARQFIVEGKILSGMADLDQNPPSSRRAIAARLPRAGAGACLQR